MQTDTPVAPFGGMEEIDVSPDGRWAVYLARVGGREQAWTTNNDVFLVPLAGGKAVDLTVANKAYDFDPTFSPDGRELALTMMKRPGFEADRTRLAIMDMSTRKLRVVTEGWDHCVDGITWARDGKTIYTTSDNVGNHSVFAIDVTSGNVRLLADKGTNESPRPAGDRVVFAKDTLTMPTELFTMRPDGSDVRQITHFNDARVKAIAWGAYEQFEFKGAKNETVHGFVMKPAGFTGAKVPVAFIIHGGPQGSMGDHFHYRWNPEVFAGHGYGVVFIDFHGSSGYGQAFDDSISGDWGGAPYEDLMKGLDAALAKYPWLDGTHAVALGASYGGYMINWIQGNTKRFKALVCHDGIFDEPLRLLRHRGGLVPRVGARRHAVDQAGGVREVQPDRARQELDDARALDPRRSRLPDPRDPGDGRVHRATAPRHREPVPRVPRREPLGAQATELAPLARRSPRLDRSVREEALTYAISLDRQPCEPMTRFEQEVSHGTSHRRRRRHRYARRISDDEAAGGGGAQRRSHLRRSRAGDREVAGRGPRGVQGPRADAPRRDLEHSPRATARDDLRGQARLVRADRAGGGIERVVELAVDRAHRVVAVLPG